MQPEQSEGRPANDRTDKEFKALEDALLLSAADNPVVDLIANDSLPKNVQHIDEAGKSEGPVECPISVSDSLVEMDGNLSDHNTPLVASSGDAVMHPEELTQNVESRRNEPECEPLLPLENLLPREESKNGQETDVPSQDLDVHSQLNIESSVGTDELNVPPFLLVSPVFDVSMVSTG